MSQIIQLVRALSQPVLLEHDTLVKLAQIFQRKIGGEAFDGAALHAELGIAAPRTKAAPDKQTTIQVIPIQGMIAQHPQSLGTSTDEVGAALASAIANPRVDAILLDVDSPGGTVNGVPELAAKIAAARAVKPITALANGLMASAAYWLGSQADEVVVAPSGETGSIGVYQLHEDWTQKLANEGIKIRAVSAGRYKLEGAPWEPLDVEAEAFMQKRVDEVYQWFVRDVAKGRNAESQRAVRDGYGEGRVLGAEQSVRAKLADRVATFEETVGRLATRVQRRGPSADILRRRLELDTLG